MASSLKLILKPEVRELLDSFSTCFGVRIACFSSTGEELSVGLDKPCARFCNLLHTRLYSRQRCLDHDAKRRAEAVSRQGMICYRCHAGATEAITPILTDGILLGYVMFGQIRTVHRPAAGVVADWKARFKDTRAIESAFLELPYHDEKQLQHITRLFSVMVNYITSQSLVSLRGTLLIKRITAYMREHLDHVITLTDIARTFHKSPSTLSHLFKKTTGTSFKRTLITLKLDKADCLFRAEPDITVAEVSAKLGYEDPFYFSRIYRKYRGHPPSSRFRSGTTV